MMVDIAPQQQLTEIFTSNHSHHRSSSSSSSTHRRNSNSNSSSSSQSTISNGHRLMSEDLGRKAEQILGHARNAFGYSRQTSLDFTGQNPIRLNISQTKAIPPSRNPNSVSQPAKSTTSETSSTKTRRSVTVEELLPLIFQLVAAPKFDKLPERISRCQPDREPIDTVMKSREMTDSFHRTTDLQLSDDENEDEDDDDDEDLPSNKISQSVLTETSEQNNMKNKSHHQTNSNENRSSAHPYENQIETEHSGQSSSRCEEDDSEDDDSDNQEAAHSDAENEDQNNPSNPSTLSLMYFIPQNEPMYEPVQSSFKQSPESNPIGKKRSISPDPERDEDNHVHNCEDHQNKRQKLLIKRALLKSFVSSVNTKIDMKRPSLPICIPTSLLLDQCSTDSTSSKSNGQTNESDIAIDRSQRASKRQLNGFVKKEKSNNTDITAQTSQSNSSNNSINETYPKKTKTPPSNDKTFSTQSTTVKNESTIVPPSSNDGEDRNRSNKSPRSTVPEKKEKTLIKSVPQSTPTENLSMSNESRKLISMKLKNLSKADLTTLGRKKKKEADNIKSLTVSGAREAMSLYLESVCYFIQCANEESKIDQRIGLLSTTLTMLQQLVSNYQKLFCVNASQPSDALQSIRQKFLLINYWLQSLIYHLQFNTNMPTIERAAGQVTDYFNQLKNPSSSSNKTSQPQQSTPNNDSNPISPLSVNSQTSASDSSTNQSQEQHRSLHDFSKLMLSSYYSTYYWNKAERLMREKPLKDFTEQLLKQNQNRHLSRDDPPLEFLLYMFDAIELLRVSVA